MTWPRMVCSSTPLCNVNHCRPLSLLMKALLGRRWQLKRHTACLPISASLSFTLLATKCDAAGDYIWALREDPGFLFRPDETCKGTPSRMHPRHQWQRASPVPSWTGRSVVDASAAKRSIRGTQMMWDVGRTLHIGSQTGANASIHHGDRRRRSSGALPNGNIENATPFA
jgi:hypothetical protein